MPANAARGAACPTLKLVELVCLDLAKDKACNWNKNRAFDVAGGTLTRTM